MMRNEPTVAQVQTGLVLHRGRQVRAVVLTRSADPLVQIRDELRAEHPRRPHVDVHIGDASRISVVHRRCAEELLATEAQFATAGSGLSQQQFVLGSGRGEDADIAARSGQSSCRLCLDHGHAVDDDLAPANSEPDGVSRDREKNGDERSDDPRQLASVHALEHGVLNRREHHEVGEEEADDQPD